MWWKVQQLVFIKTTEGEIFGGYTKEGYRSRNDYATDDNGFAFSLSNKKIYNPKKGKKIVYDYTGYGPCLNSDHAFIKIFDKMLVARSSTCLISESYFEGMKIDFSPDIYMSHERKIIFSSRLNKWKMLLI